MKGMYKEINDWAFRWKVSFNPHHGNQDLLNGAT